MTIEFPDRPAPWYDVDDHTITFPVRVNGHPCSYVVTAEGLVAHFGGQSPCAPAEAVKVYENHKDAIRRLAEVVVRADPTPRRLKEYVIDLMASGEQNGK